MEKKGRKARGVARLSVLSLPLTAALVLPSIAASAAAGGSTVRATIGGDGSVQSVKVYAPGGGTSSFNGQLPIKVSISRTVSGRTSTYTYHVENTFSKTQDVTYKDTAGKTHTATTDLQLPLVAQLGIELPKSFKDVSAPQGVVETNPDGINRILYQLVLFSPLGSPTQDVTFTATGSGAPTMELSAVAVNPSTTSGLSQAGQDANASSQQDDFWAGFASGGNGGLTQLATGMDQLVAGLNQATPGAHKLADGLAAAEDGAKKLDAGTAQAFAGSKKLLAGTKSAHSGSVQIASGTKAAHTGSTQLAAGIGQIHGGNVSLAGGLDQISGGLAQLANPTTGLNSAVVGLQTIQGFMAQVIAGIGSTSDAPTASLLGGLAAIDAGLKDSLGKLQTLSDGLLCAGNTIETVVTGAAAGTTPTGCASAIPVPLAGISDPFSQAVLVGTAGTPGVALQLLGAQQLLALSLQPPSAGNPSTLPAVIAGVEAVIGGLTHAPGTTSATDPGGVKEVLTGLNGPAGLGKVVVGLQGAVTGVNALNTGAATADAGAHQLATGSAAALTGSQQLAAGLGLLQPGTAALAAGLGSIVTGTGQLSSGLGQLSAGQHQVATGLPAAVTGAGQLATGMDQITAGAVQVDAGIKAVQSGAVSPLLTQLQTASLNAKKQLAILDASTALAAESPGGQGVSYVLTQSKTGFRLAASNTAASTSSSHTGRNVGIGLGGLVVLVLAVTAGFALGRRARITA